LTIIPVGYIIVRVLLVIFCEQHDVIKTKIVLIYI